MLALLLITLLSFQEPGISILEEPQPAFPGGETALKQFLQQHVQYPATAIAKKEEGYVVVKFTVDVQGNVTNPVIINGYRHQYALEKEALRIVRKMPRWIPAKRFKKVLAVDFYLPISFSLSEPVNTADTICYLPILPTAEYPGGSEAMKKFLNKNSRYALDFETSNTEGRIFVQFIVDARGVIRNPVILRPGKNPLLEKEAIRLVNLMPRWKPCLQEGKLVAVQWNLPVPFMVPKEK